ncbi:MAG: PTS sugar transporter subunit IIC [Lacrimispora sphenoides]
MNTVQVLLLSVFIAVLILENYGYGYWMISRPIFAGPLIGLLLGDLKTGLLVGGSVELMYMGVIPVGGSVPPNAQIAGILSTVFAILNGGNAEVGIALALPIGLMAQLLIMFAWNLNIVLIHGADKYVQTGDHKMVDRMHLCGLVVFFFVFFIPTFLAIQFGSEFVNSVVAAMPPVLTDGLKIASGILPAVGMAMLLKMMNFKKYWSFFALGFVFSIYLGLNVLAISIIALALVFAIYTMRKKEMDDDDGFGDEEEESGAAVGMLGRKELKKVFWRSFFFMTTINYERYCSLGFCYAMIPALKVLYPKQADLQEAMQRHNEFFNCHPYTGNAVLGVSLALEEQRAAAN